MIPNAICRTTVSLSMCVCAVILQWKNEIAIKCAENVEYAPLPPRVRQQYTLVCSEVDKDKAAAAEVISGVAQRMTD